MTKLHDLDVDEYLKQSVSVDDFDIDAEFKRVAADLAYWGAQHAEAVRAHLLADLHLDRLAAKLYKEKHMELDLQGGRVTEKAIETEIHLDDSWAEAKTARIDAEAGVLRLRAVVNAVAAKKDALQSLGAKLRLEMAGDPMVRRQHGNARDKDDL